MFEVDFIKQHFIKEVAGQKLFQIEQLEEAVLYNDYWDTSYTKYENRVGLASKGKFLEDSQDVVLDFPFKDGILTASMTKEDNEDGYDDTFLNEVIEKDEIDRWLHKELAKNIVNGKQITQNIIPNLSFFPRTANLFFSNIFFKNKKIVRSNKCKKKLFVKITGNISISFPSKSLVKFNGNQKILK